MIISKKPSHPSHVSVRRRRGNIDDRIQECLELHDKRVVQEAHPEDMDVKEYSVDASSLKNYVYTTLRKRLIKRLIDYGMVEDDARNLTDSALEVVKNGQEHAYKFEKGKKIKILTRLAPKYAEVVISYGGAPPDLKKIKESVAHAEYVAADTKKTPLELLGVRGRGYFQAKNWCDEVYVSKNKQYTEVKLRKLKAQSYTAAKSSAANF